MQSVNDKEGPAVIFVDDEPEILDILKDIFQDAPYRVECYARGRDVLRRTDQSPVLAIICDLYLGDLSGLEVLRHFQETHPQTHRVLMTGYLDEEQEDRARKSQVFHQLIPKPWDIYGLRKQVDRIVMSHSQDLEAL